LKGVPENGTRRTFNLPEKNACNGTLAYRMRCLFFRVLHVDDREMPALKQFWSNLPGDAAADCVRNKTRRRDMASHGKEPQRSPARKASGIDGTVRPKLRYVRQRTELFRGRAYNVIHRGSASSDQ
jgi:hypothetical protein